MPATSAFLRVPTEGTPRLPGVELPTLPVDQPWVTRAMHVLRALGEAYFRALYRLHVPGGTWVYLRVAWAGVALQWALEDVAWAGEGLEVGGPLQAARAKLARVCAEAEAMRGRAASW